MDKAHGKLQVEPIFIIKLSNYLQQVEIEKEK